MDRILVVGIEMSLCGPVCAGLRTRGASVYCAASADTAYVRISSPPALDVVVTAAAYSDVAAFARKVTPSAAVVVIGGEILSSDQLLDAITDVLRSRQGYRD